MGKQGDSKVSARRSAVRAQGAPLPSRPLATAVAGIPAVGEGRRGSAGHIGYLLRQAHSAHRQRMERALAEVDVTLPQFSVLTMLQAYPGASGADLARLALQTPQTVSVIVANLVRRGWLAREPHAVHGRILMLALTESGQGVLTRCKRLVAETEAMLLAGLSDADEAVVRRWLVAAARAGA